MDAADSTTVELEVEVVLVVVDVSKSSFEDAIDGSSSVKSSEDEVGVSEAVSPPSVSTDGMDAAAGGEETREETDVVVVVGSFTNIPTFRTRRIYLDNVSGVCNDFITDEAS